MNKESDFTTYPDWISRSAEELLLEDNFQIALNEDILHMDRVVKRLRKALALDEEHLLQERADRCSKWIDDRMRELRLARQRSLRPCDIDARLARRREIQTSLQRAVSSSESAPDTAGVVECLQLAERQLKELRAMKRAFTRSAQEHLTDLDLTTWIPDFVLFHEVAAQRDKVEFQSDVRFKKVVRMDERRPGLVLHNLIQNSIDAIGARNGKRRSDRGLVRVSAREAPMDGQKYLQLSVQDNGQGMHLDVQEGLVLGSAVCDMGHRSGFETVRRIAAWYDGYVQVSSVFGLGSLVVVGLNLATIPEVG